MQINIEWINWVAECTAMKVDNNVIKKTMMQAGIAENNIEKLLSNIHKIPGFAALEKITYKCSKLQSEIDELKASIKNNDPIIPNITNNNKSFITIDNHTIKIQSIFNNPNIVLFSDFLTKDECSFLINLSIPKLKASEGIDSSTGKNMLMKERTSYGTYFQRNENEIISKIENRISKVLNFPVFHGEGLQIIKYDIGQEYVPHYDYFVDCEKNNKVGGQRVGTLIMYLNNPDEGGETVFPNVGLNIKPILGNAVFFNYPDDSNQNTLHGGNPVISGEKWIATKWIRMQKV